MRALPTALAGVVVVEVDPVADGRGLFARTFDAALFRAWGLADRVVQTSTSFNARALTLRGLHLQVGSPGEDRLVRCTRGRVFDVAVDLRPGSPTYARWASAELGADDRRALHVPAGCAHGFLTLEDACEVSYAMSCAYRPADARGVRWDDPDLAVAWPAAPAVLSDRDAALPLLREFVP